MKLPFGKKVSCGNYYVLKHTRSLSKKELDRLRREQGVPEEARGYLKRGALPVITVSTVTDSWRVEFAAGLTIYKAIDELPVAVDGEGNHTYYGEGYATLGNIINGWFAYTSTVGDGEYLEDVMKALKRYLDRAAEKGKEPLPDKDNEEVMRNDEETENARDALKGMAERIKSGK